MQSVSLMRGLAQFLPARPLRLAPQSVSPDRGSDDRWSGPSGDIARRRPGIDAKAPGVVGGRLLSSSLSLPRPMANGASAAG